MPVAQASEQRASVSGFDGSVGEAWSCMGGEIFIIFGSRSLWHRSKKPRYRGSMAPHAGLGAAWVVKFSSSLQCWYCNGEALSRIAGVLEHQRWRCMTDALRVRWAWMKQNEVKVYVSEIQ